MATFPDQFPGALNALVAEIERLRRQVDALSSRGLMIPMVDDDLPDNDPRNIWAFPDGRLRVRLPNGSMRNFVPTELAEAPTSSEPKPVETQPKTYRTTWECGSSATYNGSGSKRNQGGLMYYGRWNGTNGEQKAMMCFPDASIRSALAGATVRKVELWLDNRHTYWNGGANLSFGGHSNSSPPGNYSGIVRRGVAKRHFGKTESQWVTLPDWFGDALRVDKIRGLIIDQPSAARSLYGYAAGAGTNRPPRLRITYTK